MRILRKKETAVMVQTIRVPATEFARKFTTFREQVQSAGVIEVTAHNRTIGAFLSTTELDHYRKMQRREREVIKVNEMDEDTMASIMNAEYGKASE
ncbi:hypothetical protein [Agrobacterium tumefaciens]|uniref:hypothetical protein n=1 Tax=Agrobacterium tumefaciens TaxID=358 RepID=UPI0023402C73|nr:hypothetical protein [Agrobacterium tumefaciens]WCK03452.1 hypothetical protein G6L31_006375 [Agrobacterium tumefaciens]